MNFLQKPRKGFSFIEIMIVVTIIALLATLIVSSIQSARISGRDTRRVSDITEIRNALNLYYSRYNNYPTTVAVTPGLPFQVSAASQTIYLEQVPMNPTPRNDVSCGDKEYEYYQTSNGFSYTLTFCLG